MNGDHELDPKSLGDHVDRLYRAAWGLCGSREEAEDLVQETFLHVLRRPRVVRSQDDIGYLLRVLRNTFISSRRTVARRPLQADDPNALELIEDRSAPDPAARFQARELYVAIAELPPDFRDALVAIDLVGLSYREAARALRTREATITTRLHRARRRLAQALTETTGQTDRGRAPSARDRAPSARDRAPSARDRAPSAGHEPLQEHGSHPGG